MAMVSGKMATSKPQGDVAMPYRQMGDFNHNWILQFCKIGKEKAFFDSGKQRFRRMLKKRFFSL
jgi:hypothetical protein